MKKKSILLSAFAAIAICVSLICGTTYALFTSQSETNIAINSAKVNVKAEIENIATTHYDDNTKTQEAGLFSGKPAEFKSGVLSLNDIVPGDKIAFDITIQNNSTVSVNYQTRISCVEGVELMRGLEVSVGSTVTAVKGLVQYSFDWSLLTPNQNVEIIHVEIEFPFAKLNQNEFQGLSAKLNFVVEAVQGNAKVENPVENIVKTNEVIASSFEVLKAALQNTVPTFVSLDSDIIATESLLSAENANVTIDFNGHMVSHQRAAEDTKSMNLFEFAAGSNIVLKNGSVLYDNSVATKTSVGYTILTYGNLTLENMDVSDVNNWSALVCTKDGAKLEIYSGTYTSDIQYALKVDALSEAVIYGGTFVSNCTKAYTLLNAGILTIYDGEFLAPAEAHVYSLGVLAGYDLTTNTACKTVTNIYGGYFSSGNPNYGLIMTMNGMQEGSFEKVNGGIEFNVYGGVFDGYFLWSVSEINNPLTSNTTQNVYDEAGNLVSNTDIIPDKITIYGGKYIGTWPFTESDYTWFQIPENHYFVLDTDDWWNVVEGVTSEEELVASIEKGGSIVLGSDVEISNIVQIQKDTVLDLNGKTLTNSVANERIFNVLTEGAHLEITSSVEGASLVIPEENENSYGFVKISKENVSVLVENITLTGNTDTGALIKAFAENWSVTMNNVTTTTNNFVFVAADYYYSGTLNVTGGNYTLTSAAPYAGFAADYSTSTFKGVTANSSSRPFAEIVGGTATFEDCILGDTQNSPSGFGHMASPINANNGAYLTINSGEYTGKYGVYVCNSGATVEINGGTFNGSTYDLKADGVAQSVLDKYPDRVSKFILNGGTFVNDTLSATSGAVIEDKRN